MLCEKPMSLSLADCDAMIAASRQSGAPLMIAQCIRFWPEYQFLKDLVRSGEAGKLLSLQMWCGGSTPGWKTTHWMKDPARSGGAILDLHIHDIDFRQYLLGLPKRIYACGGCASGKARGIDYVLTNLNYGDGTQVSASSHWADVDMPFIALYEVRFEHAFVRLDPTQQPSLSVYRQGSSQVEHSTFSELDSYTGEIARFAKCVREGRSPERYLPVEARNSVAIIMAAKASIASGQPEPMANYLAWVEWRLKSRTMCPALAVSRGIR